MVLVVLVLSDPKELQVFMDLMVHLEMKVQKVVWEHQEREEVRACRGNRVIQEQLVWWEILEMMVKMEQM